MLKKEDFVHLGKFLKPHGTKGEIGLQGDIFMLDEDECNFVACDIDGILVPFFFESMRQKNDDTLIVKVERMESAEAVRYLTNRDAYIPRNWSEESDEVSLSYFLDFKATDTGYGHLGTVVDIDESTINALFVIDGEKGEILIPAQEEFIASIDHERKEIVFDLPEGLVSL
jgi:16S rRNA processing protein RimM